MSANEHVGQILSRYGDCHDVKLEELEADALHIDDLGLTVVSC